MTTTSHASYTEERPLVTVREFLFSFLFVGIGSLIGILSDFTMFTLIIPLSIFLLIYREWKLLSKFKDLKKDGVIRFEPRFRSNRREANRTLTIVIFLIVIPMILSYFLSPLPWISLTMAFVMAWPASNILEMALQRVIEMKTGMKLRRFFNWSSYGNETVMKDYGWVLESNEERHP
ncbi:hypothetical protein [Metallosphaera hakonensis]|uniref:Uncharacterized protein n=1 Tax=Metallosphaera hakonensis JCM 8857 = DSM 7519 TaxID=1293036 RepID=A0A2U9IWR7_9CREN|nr:hypothetical protein [Metallosphaera hakonensis]AWS00541.1 hypothetical protein DFR87_03950 [Metallosphaera hakonensis JCM 8857 = DSM 7519]